MELKQKALELKSNSINAFRQWTDSRIESFFIEHPQFTKISPYIKRGINNLLLREDKNMEKWIDYAMLFLADEYGNYDAELLFDDAMSIFKDMPEKPFDFGPIRGTFGKGSIRVELPTNVVTSFVFGDIGAIRITQSDFEELRTMFTDQYQVK